VARLPENADELTEYLLRRDPRLRQLSKRILRQQARLQREVTVTGNRAYLALEQIVNERCFELVARVWKIARFQGRRARGATRRSRTRR
jgi:hypothetical protein